MANTPVVIDCIPRSFVSYELQLRPKLDLPPMTQRATSGAHTLSTFLLDTRTNTQTRWNSGLTPSTPATTVANMRVPRYSWFVALMLATGCHRIADEDIDLKALRVETCLQACDTFDTCDPARFQGLNPEDCFERCTTLLPNLHEENQCGSREMIQLECVANLGCDDFWAMEEGNDLANHPPDYSAPCVTALHWASDCSTGTPFDLDEVVPPTP